MKNLIPQFIHNKYTSNETHGKFKAVTMFMDMSGFTVMTETLMKHGREGAEVLSSILNDVFSPIIDAVYDWGGFISGFAGDAFTAIFPDLDKSMSALHSAIDIHKFFKEKGLHKTPLGDFQLYVKIGLSLGSVEWGIVGDDEHKSYYFKGSAIDGCAKSEHRCDKMNIILDSNLYNLIHKKGETNTKSITYYKLNKLKLENKPNPTKLVNLNNEVLNRFLPDKVLNFAGTGELRDIVSVFISYDNIFTHEELNEFVIDILAEVNKSGAYMKGLDFGDKGKTILVVFGSPVSYENDLERAINFTLSLKDRYGDNIKAGITYGTVYAGIVGSSRRYSYDVLGDTVNISSRLMSGSNWGDLWVSKEISNRAFDKFNFRPIGNARFKGKGRTVEVFELMDKKNVATDKPYQGDMVGRNNEVSILKKQTENILNKLFGGVVYVYGEAGIGKTRFIYEVTQSYGNRIRTCTLQCDSILKKSLNPIIYFLNEFFGQNDAKSSNESEDNFSNVFDDLLKQLANIGENKEVPDDRVNTIVEELKRTKSLLKAVLGLDTSGTLYEKLEPKLKFQNTMYSIKSLFKGLSLIQPLIIQIEDIHWIDEDSKTIIQSMTRAVYDYPFIIIATSRYNDDGSKPVLLIDDDIKPVEIELKELGIESVEEIISMCLGYKADDSLLSFINDRTQSNPFYVEQFCLYLMEIGIIELRDNIYHLCGHTGGIPRGINSILVARIDRLSAELKELVQIASVLGREFDVNVLNDVLKTLNELIGMYETINKDDFDVRAISTILKSENVRTLLADGSKEGLWSEFADLKYIFKHALLVQSAYDMQLRKRLRNLHRVAGETIERLYRNDPSYYVDIAHHFEIAGIISKTKSYLEKAGDYFKEEYHNKEAIDTYDNLIALGIDDEKMVSILIKKSEIFDLIGKWNEATGLLRVGIALTEKLDHSFATKIKRSLGEMLRKRGEYDEAMELLCDAKDIAEKVEDKSEYSKAIGSIGNIFLNKGDYDNAMKCYKEKKEICSKLGDKIGYSKVIGNMGNIYMNKGDYDSAMKCYNEKKEICSELDDKGGYSSVIMNIGNVYLYKGDPDQAMECYKEYGKICSELGDKSGYSIAVMSMGNVYVHRGDYDNAMVCYEERKNICSELGDKRGYSYVVVNMGLVYNSRKDYENAMKCYNECKEICSELGDRKGYSIAIGNIGALCSHKGDLDNAMKYCDEHKNVCSELGDKKGYSIATTNIGDIHARKGCYDDALKCYEESKMICSEIGDKSGYLLSTGNMALVHLNKGDYDNAIKLYDESIELARKLGVKSSLCSYLNYKAQVLFNMDNISEAKSLNNEALQIAKEEDSSEDIFNASILHYKIDAELSDKSKAIKDLSEMLNKYTDDKDTATIHYELWKLTGNDLYKNTAMAKYSELYEKTPDYEYKMRVDEMG